MRPPTMLLVAGLGLAATPLAAQTTGVFDPGTLTVTLATDAVTQSEEGRAGIERDATPQRSRAGSSARAGCARRAEFRARFGADDPKVRRLYALCARAGY